MIDNNIEINNIDSIEEIDSKNINDFIANKENEIKNVLLSKIDSLQSELEEYKKNNSELLSTLSNLQLSNNNNLKIIKERDSDLKSYEDKFNNLSNNIREKDIEISNLKNKIEYMEIKIKQEKEEKMKNEEYNKYKINKQKHLHKEVIDSMNIVNGELNSDIYKLKKNIVQINDKNKKDLELFNTEKNKYEMKILELQRKINYLKNDIKDKNEIIEDIKLNSNKTTNENINIIREKIKLEQKVKTIQKNSQDYEINLNLINQKNKFLQNEINEIKKENNLLNNKIENYINQIDELKEENFKNKENSTKKEYEKEAKDLEIKLLNNRIKELNNNLDNLMKEKLENDNKYNLLNKEKDNKINDILNDNINLKKDIDSLNNKINELISLNKNLIQNNLIKSSNSLNKNNINKNLLNNNKNNNILLSLQDSKLLRSNSKNFKRGFEDSVQDAFDFLKNNDIITENNNIDNIDLNKNKNNYELENKIKEMKLEMDRIKEEYAANENNYTEEINEYKQKEEQFNKVKDEYIGIVNGLQEKISKLSDVYEEQKNKIIKENKEKIEKYKKENKKIKEEKNSLIKLCSELKIEINRLENNLSMAQKIIEGPNSLDVDNKINFNENHFFKYNNYIMDNNNNENKNKEYIENGNGAYIQNNTKNNENIDLDNRYIDPELIKQKARNDVDLLLIERGINENKDKKKNENGNKNLSNNKNINNKNKIIKKNNKNNNIKTKKKNIKENNFNNIDYLIDKYDLDDNEDIKNKQLNDFLLIKKIDPIETASTKLKLYKK